MRFLRIVWLSLGLCAFGVRAELPEYQVFTAEGDRLVLWVASEYGRSEPELEAAKKLAAQGVEVWSLDPVDAYFLPPLPRSLDEVPPQDMADWLRAALSGNRQVAVFAVARAAVPVLAGAARLGPAQRARLRVLLMHPNLYTSAEPLAEPDYLDVGELSGLKVRILQPRRSAATPWLPGLLDHLALHGASVSHVILENLREGYWEREIPTDFEVAESQRMDAMLLRELGNGEDK